MARKLSPIAHVAIKHNGVTHFLARPNRHHHVIWFIVQTTDARYVDGHQGFLDADGKFLNRQQALRRAIECGQLKPNAHTCNGMLFSEDVW